MPDSPSSPGPEGLDDLREAIAVSMYNTVYSASPASTVRSLCRVAADALIAGPLAPILADGAAQRERAERAEAALAEIETWLDIMRPLVKAATGGPWYHYDEVFRPQFGQRRVTEIQVRRTGKAIVKWTGFDGVPTERKRNANAALMVGAVNGVRRFIAAMDRRPARAALAPTPSAGQGQSQESSDART